MEHIKEQIIEWAKNHISENFVFRENQLETISTIISEKLSNKYAHHIIQAPTGSGKSLINIISTGVLWEYYQKKSYILCSDLYLYQQYVDFIDKHNLEDFRYVKGQTGNYTCAKAKGDARSSACKMAKISYGKLYTIINGYDNTHKDYKELQKIEKVFKCIKSCKFLNERISATEAPITLMTYHLFYFQMNICKEKYDKFGRPILGQFLHRDYIFCDECHNIPMIMQSRCQPNIQYDDFKRMLKIFNYYKALKKDPTKIKLLTKVNETTLSSKFKEYWPQMIDNSLDSYHNTILLLNYTSKLVDKVYMIGERIQSMFGTKIRNGLSLTETERDIYNDVTWLQNYHCYLDDFSKAIELTGYHHTYKQISKGGIKFGCVKEDGIIYSFLLKFATSGTTLCSATLGNIDSFIENCGYKHFKDNSFITQIGTDIKEIKLSEKVHYMDIPSNFNFEYSPIYLDFEHKMNFSNKKISIIPISAKVNAIMDSHFNENGIIQTGSYENAKNIYKNLSAQNKQRALIYSNTKEKEKYLKYINKHTNYVIIGPSLNEGIDLPGELCTFVIIAKVPYLSLGDKYVTSKMKIFKKWYNDTAATNIIQGIGRGNRYKDDWSSIYIIDGAFKRLYSLTKKYWPTYITDRFIYGNVYDILTEDQKEMA